MVVVGPYRLVTRTYDVALPQLDPSYDGLRILQVSDVHHATHELVGGAGAILAAARTARPHLIAITGDLMDRRLPDPQDACALVTALAQVAPTFYVTGNHERTPLAPDGTPIPRRTVCQQAAAARKERPGNPAAPRPGFPGQADLFSRHRARIEKAGAVVLEGKTVAVAPDGTPCEDAGQRDGLILCGVRDPWPIVAYDPPAWDRLLEDVASRAKAQAGARGATVLLSHRPERVDAYARTGVDLALTGHAHGGQVRLPLIGALVAPNQGPLPRYARGLYRVGPTTLVVSSGVGTTGYRLRLLCPPEVVLVRLRCGVQKDSTQR